MAGSVPASLGDLPAIEQRPWCPSLQEAADEAARVGPCGSEADRRGPTTCTGQRCAHGDARAVAAGAI